MVAKQRTLNFAMAFAHKLNLISKRARQRNGSLKRYYELEHKCVCLNLKKGTPEKRYNKFVFSDIRNFYKKYGQFVKYQVVTHW